MKKSNIDPLVIQYKETKDEALKEKILENYTPLVEYIARRFAFNRSDTEDLIQIGSIAILKALDRFQTDKNTDFATFATPNIIGEIKHFFRDKSKLVKVPRRLQEQYSKIKTEIKNIQDEGKKPQIEMIAQRLEITQEQVLEAMEAGQQGRVLSLDAPSYTNGFFKGSGQETTIGDSISNQKDHEETFLTKEILKQSIMKLQARERRIVYLRFYGGLSQAEIAERMNLSQMHISRLLSKAMKTLKNHLGRQNA